MKTFISGDFLSSSFSGYPLYLARYHAHTLLLFTIDQIFDTIISGTAFSLLAASSGVVLYLPNQNVWTLLPRIPLVAAWLRLLILQACLQNQRSPDSIEEDLINKPWRPIPSKRISRTQTEYLLTVAYVVAGITSYVLDTLSYWEVYVLLLAAYNDRGSSDHSGTVRNIFCGAAFACYFGGALSIALGPDVALSPKAIQWTLIMTCGVLATTFHTQDFRDEAGDRARDRKTLVTELGRTPALCTVIFFTCFWSLYISVVFFGGGVIVAALLREDRRMYKVWCLWVFGLCPLPLIMRTANQSWRF
ncbi:hypothetical protein EK21DRAFT_105439 [Setomelanomma holmii]|uniref:UbiA prenyltransferase n=1 Tax=Setomelanomma holmii TaxID=210430 RepID=A0A9P4LGI1_9PLEO|nr:hypothetical protein EK21DRAFT_105439 [Setomelanomma holmii]